MRPTFDEIRCAAYDRWERRGGIHGGDRDDWYAAQKELTFARSYRTIVDFEFDGPGRVLGDANAPVRRCRFCERTPGDGEFGRPRPVVPDRASLLSAEICDDCQFDWRDGLEDEFRRFWARLQCDGLSGPGGLEHGPRPLFSVAAFKSLVAGALLIVPGAQLPFFVDALEWVSNPDHDSDDRLLHLAECWFYRAPFLGEGARASLARRVDDEAPVPYMLFFLSFEGIMVQVPLPMCLRDADLDGREVVHPGRALAAGFGPDFREAHGVLIPLAVSGRRPSRERRRPSIAS
jgi:hypothetical protein